MFHLMSICDSQAYYKFIPSLGLRLYAAISNYTLSICITFTNSIAGWNVHIHTVQELFVVLYSGETKINSPNTYFILIYTFKHPYTTTHHAQEVPEETVLFYCIAKRLDRVYTRSAVVWKSIESIFTSL